jgi:hypothetical protein
MIFKTEDDAGPWYLSSEQREASTMHGNSTEQMCYMVKESSDESTDISWSRTFTAEEFQEARSASFGKAMLSMHYKYYSPIYIFQLIQNYMHSLQLHVRTPQRVYASTV